MPAPEAKIQRMFYIDNIRWLMIVLVIVIHANVIYGPVGQFFGIDYGSEELGVADIIMALISILVQTFFMGVLFLIAGYFVPNSLARKGEKKFVWDRFIRLGIPALIFIFFLAPSIDYPVWAMDEMSFSAWALNYYPYPWNWDNGPMWFAIALLIFSIAWIFTPSGWTFARFKGSLTRTRVAIIMAVAIIGTILVRIPFPIETDVWNMQLCFFTQYIVLFVVGIIACHKNWLSTIPKKDARFYALIAVATFFLVLIPLLVFGGALDGDLTPAYGGLHWQAVALALFEQVFGISVVMWLLIWFRERYNRQGWIEKKLSDNAFAVYVFHPPIVAGLAIMIAGVELPGFLKFILVAAGAILITFSLAELVLRRIPLLKKVL